MFKNIIILVLSTFILFSCSKKNEIIKVIPELSDRELALSIYSEALDALKKHSNTSIKKISIDGKLSTSKLMRKILSSIIRKDFYFASNSNIAAIGAALLASNNTSLSNKKRTEYFFKNDKMHDYLINKYCTWKRLIDNSVNL